MAGSGYLVPALAGAVVVLGINLCLQPLVSLINRQPVDPGEQDFKYSLQVTCEGGQEGSVRALLVQLAGVPPLVLHQMETARGPAANQTIIKAIFSSSERQDTMVEQLASRMCLEKQVVGLTWQLMPH